MDALSAHTLLSDPYRAGVELGEALLPLAPEVVFLISTVHYGDSSELLEGLYDTLQNDELVVIGNSGDGYYESGRISDIGAAALGLNSGGAITWRAVLVENVSADPAGATRRALAQLDQALGGRKPALLFLASHFSADASQIEAVIQSDVNVPMVGGFAADDNRMQTCFVHANRRSVRDGLVLLGASGPLTFAIRVGNQLQAVGRPGTVQAAQGTNVQRIDGLSAMDFIERETGKPVLQTDRGIVSLSILDPDHPHIRRLRSIVPDFSTDKGHLGLYGGIETGKTVQVCLAQPEDLVNEVHAIAQAATQLDFAPKAAVIVSCGGRKQLLGERIRHETAALSEAFGHRLPLVGFPSFGEIGPLPQADGYSRNLFHNMTYVLLLLGDAP